MIMPVLQFPDERLKRISEEIVEITPTICELVHDMVETMYARDGIGLAAPQVGEAIRLVVVNVSGPDIPEDLLVLINPKITLIGEEIVHEEGCLSVLDFTAEVTRSDRVRVEALDLEGKEISLEAEGLKAICLQHECDHLEGLLFIDHISRLKRSMYARKFEKKKKK